VLGDRPDYHILVGDLGEEGACGMVVTFEDEVETDVAADCQ